MGNNWENGRANAEEEIIQLRKAAEEDALALDREWVTEAMPSNVDTVEAINSQEAMWAKMEAKREARKVQRKQTSKRKKAYRSIDAEVADAIGLIKYRHPDTGKICWE